MKATIRLKEEGGAVQEFRAEKLEIGTSKDSDVRFDPGLHPSVSEQHATLALECGLYILYDNQSAEGTFVNGRRVSLARLQNGDEIQLGRGGPRLLFEGEAITSRLKFIAGQCQLNARMLQAMVSDSLEAVAAGKGAGPQKGPGLVQEILERAKLQHFIRLLLGVVSGFLFVGLAVAGVFVWGGDSLSGLDKRTSRQDFVVIAERNQKAVVLIHHLYQVVSQETGRPIRIMGRQPDGSPLFTEGPAGIPLTLTAQGTGFMIDRKGTILTNRHVAEPWREDERIVSRGFSGKTIVLTATFADTDRALPAQVLQVSQEVDAAALRVRPFAGMPVVQGVEPDPGNLRQGQRIAVIGFPAGVEMGGKVVTSLTTGVLSKVILEKNLQFDAPVNPGNSGGPVFNERGDVIGLVYGVGVDPEGGRLHGIYYGVPIRFALSLVGG